MNEEQFVRLVKPKLAHDGGQSWAFFYPNFFSVFVSPVIPRQTNAYNPKLWLPVRYLPACNIFINPREESFTGFTFFMNNHLSVWPYDLLNVSEINVAKYQLFEITLSLCILRHFVSSLCRLWVLFSYVYWKCSRQGESGSIRMYADNILLTICY